MTCFWDSILRSLTQDELNILGSNRNNRDLIQSFKNKNKLCENISWQGEPLHKKLLEENMEAIKEYNIGGIGSGHLCSTCDPFLCLLCELLKININNNYCNHMIKYTIKDNKRTLNFNSNTGHFSN